MELDTVADIKLVTRAFNEGWDVPIEAAREVVENARLRNRSENPRVAAAAGELLLAVAKFNQDVAQAEQKKLDAEHARKLQLIELAVKLGIAGNVGSGAGIADSQPAGIGNARSSEGS